MLGHIRTTNPIMKTTIIKPSNAMRPPVRSPGRKAAPREQTSAVNVEFVPSLLQIKSILVPIDFSMSSKKALAAAFPFAERFGAKITLLHVVEPVAIPAFANSLPLVMENDKVINSRKRRLEQLIRESGSEPKLVDKTLVRYGRSFHEITEAARTLKVDLIIISTHGYSGLKHAIMGSTTERVVRHAPCPVLVMREQEHDFA